MPSGIDLIIADHLKVAELFDTFEANPDGATVGRIIDALEAHDAAEHAALYPLAERWLGEGAGTDRAAAAHSAIKSQIELLTGLEGGPLVREVGRLRSLVEQHVAEEEEALLPALAGVAGPAKLDELGARLLQAKQRGG